MRRSVWVHGPWVTPK
ncbi:hypothetical protein [Sorlinia euscelidii]